MSNLDKNKLSDLNDKLSQAQSRRNVLKGAVAGAAGLSLAGGSMAGLTAFAQKRRGHWDDTSKYLFQIAITIEELSVAFYSTALQHAGTLGFSAENRLALTAVAEEEQYHVNFWNGSYGYDTAGATSLYDTFSLPHGKNTFLNIGFFCETQKIIEDITISFYLHLIRYFSSKCCFDIAQYTAEIVCIDAEQRIVVRAIKHLEPLSNRAFEPLSFDKATDALDALKNGGFLNPTKDNSYTYKAFETTAPALEVTSLSPAPDPSLQ